MKYASIFVALFIVGCATPLDYVATGGSRADGVVSLSYEYGAFQAPQLDEAQGIREATARCQVWGYTGAQAFGGNVQTCTMASLGSCDRWRVTRDYQCTGE